ncbi:MAG: matrixin family metalloprotease [Aigarchaeota archaeon]|nr:matrixin family metalloprotease [Aigarchaeota archaeon]MDW8092271.1 matrixin family metalloprotease [Nitrososphaerota archaeon]
MRAVPITLILIVFVILILHPVDGGHDFQSSSHAITYESPPANLTEQRQEDGVIDLLGSWRKRELNVLIYPHQEHAYTVWAAEGVRWWITAIPIFTALFGYNYLEELKINVLIYGVNGSSGDIRMRYVETLGSGICGVAYIFRAGTEIVNASIAISLSCTRGDEEITKVVAAHEFAHALGIGHTTNCRSIMCRYVVPGSRPSTLELYSLAVAYRWMATNVFENVPSRVTLPAEIPMFYLLDVQGYPIKLSVKIYRRVDGSGLIPLEVLLVEPGQSITLRSDEIVGVDSSTRMRFIGWSIGGRAVSSSPEIVIRPRYHMEVVQDYRTQYLVRVAGTFTRDLTDWFDRESIIDLEVPSVVPISEVSRLRFDRWVGTFGSTINTLRIVVRGPVEVTATWVRQFKVDVFTAHGSTRGAGWYDEGGVAEVWVEPSTVDLMNMTRIQLSGFTGDYAMKGPRVRLLIDGPKRLYAEWTTQYLVSLWSTHGNLNKTVWIDRGDTLTIEYPRYIEWDNMTRAVFRSWEGGLNLRSTVLEVRVVRPITAIARYDVEYYLDLISGVGSVSGEGWYLMGSRAIVSADQISYLSDSTRAIFKKWEGDVTSVERVVEVRVDRPMRVRAIWTLEHLISINYPEPLKSQRFWVTQGSEVSFSAPEFIYLSDRERLSFRHWSGDLITELVNVSAVVTRPLSLTARYVKEVLSLLIEEPRTGTSGSVTFELIGPGGEFVSHHSGSIIWLREGRWTVQRSIWRGADVTDQRSVDAASGEVRVGVRLYYIEFTLKDLFHLPAPMLSVTVSREDGFVESEGVTSWDGVVRLGPVSPYGKSLTITFGGLRSESSIDPTTSPQRRTVPLGPYSVLLISIVAALMTLIYLRHRPHQPE